MCFDHMERNKMSYRLRKQSRGLKCNHSYMITKTTKSKRKKNVKLYIKQNQNSLLLGAFCQATPG